MNKLGIFAMFQDRDNPGQFVETEDFIDFARELNVDAIDLFLGRGLSSTDPEYLRRIKINRFGNEVERPRLHRSDRMSDRSIAGEHNTKQTIVNTLEFTQEFNAVNPWQVKIGQDEINR